MRIFFSLLFIGLSLSCTAQLFSKEKIKNKENMDKEILSWGYYLGLNSFDFKFNYEEDLEDILVESTAGFQLGLIGDLRINDYLNLRLEPGVFFITRNLQYDESYFEGEDFNDSDLLREVKSTYVHFPLLLKASAKRINNFKPFLIGGVSMALNLSSNENNPDDNSAGQFRMTSTSYFYEVGFGVDFYLPYFKFTPSIRGIFAINDELIRDNDPDSPWTGNINSMQTRGIFVNLAFR
jgi:hypothetical protein